MDPAVSEPETPVETSPRPPRPLRRLVVTWSVTVLVYDDARQDLGGQVADLVAGTE